MEPTTEEVRWSIDPDNRHEATYQANDFIREHGWSVGPTDTTGIRGVMFWPDGYVAKWKNLTPEERSQCDAYLWRTDGQILFTITQPEMGD